VRRIVTAVLLAIIASIARSNWQISGNGTLSWDSEDYAPVGIRVSPEPAELDRAVALGFNDVLVDLPFSEFQWNQAIEELEKRKLRYIIRLNSAAPLSAGISVEPQGYRVVGITEPQTVNVELPGAKSALVVVALKNDGAVSQRGKVPVVNGRLSVEVTSATAQSERVVLIYPEQESIGDVDFWGAFDRHRDLFLKILRQSKNASGLRGIVNPLGRTWLMPRGTTRFIPNDSYYRAELARFLEMRYRSLDSAVRTWGVGNGFVVAEMTSRTSTAKPLTSFADLARLVPLWSGARGIRQFYDPDTSRLYACDSPRSRAWDDINDLIQQTQTRRYDALVRSIRAVKPVPVIQEWNGWSGLYDRKENPLNGIGVKTSGTNRSEILQTASRAVSTAIRWDRATWIVGTDVEVPADLEGVGGLVDDLRSLGARAVFLRMPSNRTDVQLKTSLQEIKSKSLVAERPRVVFFPENANEPGAPQQLPGGAWWLPSPSSGNRIDLGDRWFAYRMNTPEGQGVYLWTLDPGRHKIRFTKTNGILVKTIDGSDPNVKVVKNQIELNIGEVPVFISGTDEIPLPQSAYDGTLAKLAEILKINDTKKRDVTEELLLFSEYLKGVDRNPGGNFTLLRDMFRLMCLKIADATWIEAESSRVNTFSDSVEIGGCSNGTALTLESRIPEQVRFFAEYNVPSYGAVDLHVWIAARISPDRRGDVVITLGSQVISIKDPPVSPYGQGFAWYRVGVTQTAGALNKLVLSVNNPAGADFAFDAIYLTPDAEFRPQGTRVPMPKPFPVVEKGSGGR
jgi:hypothetical protein